MRLGNSMMLGAVLAVAVGCGGNGSDNAEYVEALPDLEGVSLEISGSASEQGAGLTAADFGVYEAALAATGPEYLQGARMQVRALNTTGDAGRGAERRGRGLLGPHRVESRAVPEAPGSERAPGAFLSGGFPGRARHVVG
jgi:hypothetical protein